MKNCAGGLWPCTPYCMNLVKSVCWLTCTWFKACRLSTLRRRWVNYLRRRIDINWIIFVQILVWKLFIKMLRIRFWIFMIKIFLIKMGNWGHWEEYFWKKLKSGLIFKILFLWQRYFRNLSSKSILGKR